MNYHVCYTSFKGIVSRDFVGLYNYLFFRLLRFHMKSVIGRATQHFNKGKVLLYTVPKIIWISVLWPCLSRMEQMQQSMSGFYADILYCIVYYTYTVPKIIWISVLWPCLSWMEQMQQSMSGFYALYCTVLYLDGLLVMLNAHGRRIKIKEKAKVVASVFILLLWLCWSTALHILFCTQRHCTSYNSAILDFFKSKDKKRRT